MAAAIAKNNVFGEGAPSWNLPFPAGNLTAAEILAYLPHWLKSVDVIDRFITNGGTANNIAVVVTEFRQIRGDGIFKSNSALHMMEYSMRKTSYPGWTPGTHSSFERPNPHMLETDLSVQAFRTPRETHPKGFSRGHASYQIALNTAAAPVEFKALGLNVKKHPTGNDALDLTRCIQYALAHPKEQLYFPNDFKTLVNKLGGPAAITRLHLDREVFGRRASRRVPPRPKSALNSNNTPTSLGEDVANSITMPRFKKAVSHAHAPALSSPLKRVMDANGTTQVAGTRKSDRLANKTSINFRVDDSDAEDKDDLESSHSGYSTPGKKRRLSRLPPTPSPASNDSEFDQVESEPDDDVPSDAEGDEDVEEASEDESMSQTRSVTSRAAAIKAREVIHDMATETQRNIDKLERQKMEKSASPHELGQRTSWSIEALTDISPEMMALARNFPFRQPIFVQPPFLSANRLRVDESSIYLYAADGCTTFAEMWESALSYSRFAGPRRSAPYRELHRLTEPYPRDVSDWAENIRWAKQQHALFGSETWTEYDYHLELITTHRRETNWVSEELIAYGHWDGCSEQD